jgi:hypothetical protein
MQSGGLRLTSLPAAQRQLFNQIELDHVYGDALLAADRCADCLHSLERATLRRVRRGESSQALSLSWPTTQNKSREERLDLGTVRHGDGSVAPGRGVASPFGENSSVPLPQGVPGSDHPLRTSQGSITVSQLLSAIQGSAGIHLVTTRYFGERQILAFGAIGSAGEWSAALTLLFGWELRHEKADHYFFGRPLVTTAHSGSELHYKIRTALPPALQLAWGRESQSSRGGRAKLRNEKIDAACKRKSGVEWTEVPLQQLDESALRLVAAQVVDELLRGPCNMYVSTPDPPGWISHPDDGWLRLTGPIDGHNHPLLSLSVSQASGRHDQIGWFVGTNSLQRR